MDRYFLSYSRADASAFALQLADRLAAGPPPFPVWMDERELRPGTDWDESIVDALRTCKAVLFVMSDDSVRANSNCKLEWTRALQYKKPVIPLRLTTSSELPFRLGSREYIDFSGPQEPALARLREHLSWMDSPAGTLHTLRIRLEDAKRDYERGDELMRSRIQDDIRELERQIAERESSIADPVEAHRRMDDRIRTDIQKEIEAPAPSHERRVRFVNRPPVVAPSWFQDRHVETAAIGEFLKDESQSLMTVVGRAGLGKTTMVCRLLNALEGGRLPDDGGQLEVDGIVYLSAVGARRVRFDHLYSDLCQLLPAPRRRFLEELYRAPHSTIVMKVQALAEAFPEGRTVVLLDNFEDVVDAVSGKLREDELESALSMLLTLPQHGIKIILTTRVASPALSLIRPERQRRLELDTGLPSPHAETILRQMDVDGKAGLRDAPPELLDKARIRTRGYPRALEAFYAILAADHDTTVEEILRDAETLLPENVVHVLVGEAFSRLDPAAQKVMQALAIYARPVPSAAVDFLLQPYQVGTDSAPILKRLVNMQFARRESGQYYLHQEDRSYALGRVAEGTSDDWKVDVPPYTRHSLWRRGAEYFRQIRRDESTWASLMELDPLFAEFELRAACGDGEGALDVLDTLLPVLDRWGHYRRIERLASRLVGDASPRIRAIAHGLSGQALRNLGEPKAAVEHLRAAVKESDIDREQQSDWRLALAGAASSLGDSDTAIAEYQRVLDEPEDLWIEPRVEAILGLSRESESLGSVEDAVARCKEALHFVASRLGADIEQEEDSASLTHVPLAEDALLEDPRGWEGPLMGFTPSDGSEEVQLFGVRVVETGPPPASVGPDADENDTRTFVLVRVLPCVAAIWRQLADLEARRDHHTDAVACCRLAADIYQALGLDIEKADALEKLASLTAELSEADAEAIREEQGQQLQRIMDRARSTGHRQAEVMARANLAEWMLDRHRWEHAEALFLESVRDAEEVEDPSLLARAQVGLASIDRWRGRTDDAVQRLEKLLEERVEDLWLQTSVAFHLGGIAVGRGRRGDAVRYFQLARRLSEACGHRLGTIQADQQVAALATSAREYEEAVHCLTMALDVARALGVASTVSSVLCDLARALSAGGQRKSAIAASEEAERVASGIELPGAKAETLLTIGNVRSELREFDRARQAFDEAERIYERTGNRQGLYGVRSATAWMHSLAHDHERELASALGALDCAIDLDDPEAILDARIMLGAALSACGRHDEGIRELERVIEKRPDDALAIGNLGWVLYEAGQYESSIERSRQALELDPAQTWTIRNLGHAFLALGRPEEAEREYRRAVRDRKGGEDFAETIHVIQTLLERRPDCPGGRELLQMLEDEQARLRESGDTAEA